jgi:hypothetical protein
MSKKIITINDIEFRDSTGEGSVHFYSTPEFHSYNKHFKSSVAYLPIDNRCFKIIRWNFAETEVTQDDRFPQYDIFEIGNYQCNPVLDSEYAIDLTESGFKEWLLREQLPVI